MWQVANTLDVWAEGIKGHGHRASGPGPSLLMSLTLLLLLLLWETSIDALSLAVSLVA